jgi:hypothetical protein
MGPPRATRRSFLSLAILASSVAGAAEYYNQPYALVSVDHHSNVDLEVDTGLRENVTGYQALLQDIFGILTPTSDTQFRPRILARQYDGRPDLSRVNEYVDGKTLIQSQRSSLELYAGASRQDSYSAETLNPQFDDFNPKAPVTAQSGAIDVGNTRTSVDFRPRYTYELSDRTGIGANAEYDMVNFKSQLPGSEVSFNYGLVNAFIKKQLSQKTSIETGVYGSDYETKQDTYKDDAYGVSFDLDHNWTQLLTGDLTVQAERDDLREMALATATAPPSPVKTFSGTNVGAFLSLSYKAQASQLRLAAGRQLVPSSAGTVEGVDQVHLQYDRNINPRFTLTGALIAERQRAISNIGAVNSAYDHDDGVALVSAQWALSRTFFLAGHYSFTRSKYVTDKFPANDNEIGISIGYRGLPAQR